VIDHTGRIAVAFSTNDSTGGSLVYLYANASDAARWSTRVWRFSAGLGYADLATDSRNVAIAYVRAPDPPDAGANVLYLLRSVDGGATWTQPQRISQAAEQPALEPHAFVRDSLVTILWTSQARESFTGGVLWRTNLGVRRSEIGPKTSTPLPGITNASQAAIDACGTVHFVVREYRPTGSVIAYTRYEQTAWTRFEYPFDTPATHPSIAIGGDTVRLIWSSLDKAPVPNATLLAAALPIGRGKSAR
jgi:hypothetical protein